MKTLYWTDKPTGARIKAEVTIPEIANAVFTFVTPADSRVCSISCAKERKLWELLEGEDKVQEATDRVPALEELVESLENQLTCADDRNEDLQEKWDRATDELEEATDKIKGLELRVEELTKERDLQKQALIDKANQAVELRQTIDRLTASASGTEEELVNARAEISELLQRLNNEA
ncbi:MAG: hypothetical protein WCZ86_06110 [Desulfurivibrionaceae bacterium]